MLSARNAESEEVDSLPLEENFSFDTVIVFGQGPVKPVVLEKELTPNQRERWNTLRNDSTQEKELPFFVMQQPRQLAELEKIENDTTLDEEVRQQKIAALRQQWQQTGWFAMKHWCRQNAMAAGLALYKGLTKNIILSGGKTMRKEVRSMLPAERIAQWPSEAQLMADTIRSTYGELYLKKYGHSIDERIRLEDSSTNTLENFACSIRKYPQLLEADRKVGFLTTQHHLDRVAIFGQLFSLKGGRLCSQELLKVLHSEKESSVLIRESSDFREEYVEDIELIHQEKRWRAGVQEPEYVTYWLGFVAMTNNPIILQNAIERLNDPRWLAYGEKAFARVGLKLSDYKEKDLTQLARTDAIQFNQLAVKLAELKKSEHRLVPPMQIVH